MVSGLFAILFPPPKYLAQPAFGLDISDRSLKYIKLRPGRRHFSVERFGEKALPAGLIESGKIKDSSGLTKACHELRQELKEPYVVVSLPEEHAFILRISLPYMKALEIRTSIELQLEQHVPLKPENAVFDYEAIMLAQAPGQTSDLAVTVFPRALVLDYHHALLDAGFRPLAYEIEAQAIARSVIQNKNSQTVMIIDFGKTRTSFFVTNSKKVLFTSTLANVGGENLTQSVKKNLNLSYEEAEKLKERHGLLSSQNKELVYALMPTLSVFRDEINKIYNYWNTHQAGPGQAISAIVICGGQATLPGLTEYLSVTFTVPVTIGDVWSNVMPISTITPPINFNQSQKYATSLGLALKQFHD